MLTVEDQFAREALATETDFSLPGKRVVAVQQGRPAESTCPLAPRGGFRHQEKGHGNVHQLQFLHRGNPKYRACASGTTAISVGCAFGKTVVSRLGVRGDLDALWMGRKCVSAVAD